MTQIIRPIIMLAILSVFLVIASSPVKAQFDPLQPTCDATSDTQEAGAICADSANPPENDPTGDNGIVVRVANLIAIVAGVIAVFIMVIAGITMITSNGDPGKVTKSKNTIIYVAIGLIVIMLARTIVTFVITRFIA